MLQKIRQFLAEVALEGKRIHWPNRRDLVDSTLVVIFFIVLLAIVIMFCDEVIRRFLAIVLG
ncbi:MAG: preprotein translocase subunit SecE [Kiritimatiellae bacterium]|nr:preprotein translocase subunit SecE [Kiritimatiellia bacterium]